MSDLTCAPSPFTNPKGQRVIFVDFLRASYRIEFDCKARKATAFSTITFEADTDGHPVILLNQPYISARLDGNTVKLNDEHSMDGKACFKILSKSIKPGIHVLTIVSKIKKKQGRDRKRPINWMTDVPATESIFHMSDLAPHGGFLERYLPSNYNFDHFAITFDVTVKNSKKLHRIFCNGTVTHLSRSRWRVQFPDYFTSSCPWFHLGPSEKFKSLTNMFISNDNRSIPITVYTNSPPKYGKVLKEIYDKRRRIYVLP